jgi:hypothetical protein
MKNLHLFLLSSTVALACTATRVSAVVTAPPTRVTWGCDTSTCFSLTISGIGPVVGGDFRSPSGDWEFDDVFRVFDIRSCLRLQPSGCSIEWLPAKNAVMLPWCSGFDRTRGGDYEAEYRMDDHSGALRGWNIDGCISYKVSNPCNPNTWRWTITCTGSGPDLAEHCWDRHGHCPAVPEPSALWLAGVGVCGLALAYRQGVGRRVRN